jgi:tetratricopeptide (TPR) repeat protein
MSISTPTTPLTPPPLRRALPRGRRSVGLLIVLCLLLPAAWAAPDASQLLNAGRPDEALRMLGGQADGDNAAAQNALGRIYYSVEDWNHALEHCERAARLAPDNAIYQLWLGRSFGQKANVSNPIRAYMLARKTVAAFQRAHTLDPGNMEIARDLAEYYIEAPAIVGGGIDKAEALADEVASEHPADAAWIRAGAAKQQGHREEAEREYRAAIRLDHDSGTPYLELARLYRSSKQWDLFEHEVSEAMRASQVRPFERYDAAELLLSTGRNLGEAERLLRAYLDGERTEERAPVFRAHFLLGQVLLKKGEREKAAAEYRAALHLAANYHPAADALRHLEKH